MQPSRNFEQGRLITLTSEHTLPISVNLFWSGLDDFLAISAATTDRSGTELVKGAGKPSNGVGTEVTFTSKGKKMSETLWQKDDLNHIWTVGISEPTEDFLYYRGTLTAWEGANGPCAQYTVDVILAGDEQQKGATLDSLKNAGNRVLDILLFVLDRNGARSEFEFEVGFQVEKLWNVISDWNNVSWIVRSEKVERIEDKYGKQNRKVTLGGDGCTEEILTQCDERNHTITYYVYKSHLPVKMYFASMKLVAASDNKTRVNYENIYLVKDGIDVNVFKAALEKQLTTKNMPFLQEMFRTQTP